MGKGCQLDEIGDQNPDGNRSRSRCQMKSSSDCWKEHKIDCIEIREIYWLRSLLEWNKRSILSKNCLPTINLKDGTMTFELHSI